MFKPKAELPESSQCEFRSRKRHAQYARCLANAYEGRLPPSHEGRTISRSRAFLKSIGSDQISPLFEKALTHSVTPAMATTTDALAAFVRWDLYRNAILRFMENYDAVRCRAVSGITAWHQFR
jgi:hypothetical protein